MTDVSNAAERLSGILQRRYGTTPLRLSAARHGLNPVFRVERQEGSPWYVRAGRAVPRIARALLFLEEQGADGPRLVPAADGAPYVEVDGEQVLVMSAVEGETPLRTPEAMLATGAALGRLHALGPLTNIPALDAGGGIELPALRRAGMLPTGEVAAALAWLERVRKRIPIEHQAHFDALREACDTLRTCEDLPTVFIHGDAHYNNTILTPSGRVVYVDYDSAGPGPAVVDLGFLLVNADGGPIVSAPEPAYPECVEAVIRGYCAHAALTEGDLGHLVDGIRLRPLVLACAKLKSAIVHGRAPARWPLERVLMADDLADRATGAITAIRAVR